MKIILLSVLVLMVSLHPSHGYAKTPTISEENQAEILLRALLDAGDNTIRAENQHCNVGEIYSQTIDPQQQKSVKIKEPLIAEIAEMVSGGNNKVKASCNDNNKPECTLSFSHAKGENVSGTEFRFSLVDGKVDVDSLKCVSTP